MGNPTYQRTIICDSTDVATRMVAAAETELQPHYLERLPPSVAEAERGWFDQQVGGLSRSPESIAAAFGHVAGKSDVVEVLEKRECFVELNSALGSFQMSRWRVPRMIFLCPFDVLQFCGRASYSVLGNLRNWVPWWTLSNQDESRNSPDPMAIL